MYFIRNKNFCLLKLWLEWWYSTHQPPFSYALTHQKILKVLGNVDFSLAVVAVLGDRETTEAVGVVEVLVLTRFVCKSTKGTLTATKDKLLLDFLVEVPLLFI